MVLNVLFTAFALFAALAAGLFTWYTHTCTDRAIAARDELASGLRKLAALREEVETLHKRLDRVSGRVYAQGRRPPRPVDDDGLELPDLGGPNGELDPELAAELALQSAPAVAPGKRSA